MAKNPFPIRAMSVIFSVDITAPWPSLILVSSTKEPIPPELLWTASGSKPPAKSEKATKDFLKPFEFAFETLLEITDNSCIAEDMPDLIIENINRS